MLINSSVQVSELEEVQDLRGSVEDASTVTKRQQNKKKTTPRCLGEINKEAKNGNVLLNEETGQSHEKL